MQANPTSAARSHADEHPKSLPKFVRCVGKVVMDGDGGVSIGNYKGVMLCNRPAAAGGDAGGKGGADVKNPPFKAGIPSERVNPRGYDPGLSERVVCSPRSVLLSIHVL